MPNRKNAIIKLRQDKKRTIRNNSVKSKLKTERKNFEKLISKKEDKETVKSAFSKLSSVIDKTCKKGVIPYKRGSRIKSRYSLKINSIS